MIWRGAASRSILAALVILVLLVLPVATRTDLMTASGAGRSHLDATTRERVSEQYGRLQLSFEANEGQTDPQVRFLARGRGFGLYLTPQEAVLGLRQPRQSAAMRMRLVGANPKPRVSSEVPLPGKANYFIGNDPKKWRTNIPTYARVRYTEVYPGIDMVYYGHQGQLEYDFVVTPGADPKLITLSIEGADRLDVDAQGDLVFHLAGGEIRQRKPAVYQEVDGVRRQIAGGYVLKGSHQVGVQVEAYDARRPLIIDPVLLYSTYVGGTGNDAGNAIAVDTLRNAYMTGTTYSANFPVTAGAFDRFCGTDTACNGVSDVFVTKLNSTGSALIYSTYLGGSNFDFGRGIAVDTAGNAYVTGDTSSTDFPTTGGAFDTQCGTDPFCNLTSDGFVTKLNPTGSALTYSTFLGGEGADIAYGIAVDAGGNAYVAGGTHSLSFPTTVGAFDTTCGTLPSPCDAFNGDAFVAKLNPTGTALAYATYLGGVNDDVGLGVAVDALGDAYATGRTMSVDFPVTMGAFDTTANGGATDAFVTKLNPAGSAPLYSTYLGGGGADNGFGIAVDGSGNAYVTGDTRSSNFPTTIGAFSTTLNGAGPDVFVTKLNPTGTAQVYSTYLGGSGSDFGNAIAVDASGNAHVTGSTGSSDFPVINALQGIFGGATDAFVTKLNAAGSALIYSTYLGGTVDEAGAGVAVDPSGNAYVAGNTVSANFPTTVGAYDVTFGGVSDAFVTRISAVVTVGLYNPATSLFYLRNTNTTGVADATFAYGPGGAGWIPLVGDWDGNGTDTVGLYNPATGLFYLRNSNTTGFADLTFGYGPAGAGWVAIVGDWDGNGTDTVGLYNPATSIFYLRNTNTTGFADVTFGYGPGGAGWVPLTGRWVGGPATTVGLYAPATGIFYLRTSNTTGVANITFGYGPAGLGWLARAGDWDGQ